MRNALRIDSRGRPLQRDVAQAANTGSEWQFLTVAVPSGDASPDKSWFKREGSSEWERIDTFRWPQLAPLFFDGLNPANDDARPNVRKRRRWGRTLAKLSAALVLAAGSALAAIHHETIANHARSLWASYAGSQVSSEIETGLAKAVLDMRPGLPKRIDQLTTLMWVSYSGTKMIYDNRLELDGSKVDESTKAKLAQLVTVNTCGNPQSRKLLDLGGSFRYAYSDRNAKILLTVDVGKSQCL